jgi:hypothetical protein
MRYPPDGAGKRYHQNPQNSRPTKSVGENVAFGTEDGGTVAVYSDITELKQREQDLAESHKQTKADRRAMSARPL